LLSQRPRVLRGDDGAVSRSVEPQRALVLGSQDVLPGRGFRVGRAPPGRSPLTIPGIAARRCTSLPAQPQPVRGNVVSERDPKHGTFRVYALVALGLLAIVGTLGGIKYAQIATLMAAGKKAKAAGPPPEAVATAQVTAQRWPVTVDAVGTVASLRSVEVR